MPSDRRHDPRWVDRRPGVAPPPIDRPSTRGPRPPDDGSEQVPRPTAEPLRRRQLLAAAALAAAGLGCDRHERKPARARSPAGPWRELSFPATDHYPSAEHAAVLAQPEAPLLIALHGRGEAGRGLETGARGWRDDYDLGRAHERLLHPPLSAEDLLGFVRPQRLAQLNASLTQHPYRGLTVACPYTPALADRSLSGSRPFAAFIVRDLAPRVRKELGLAAARERTSIDGVSMGGRLALLVGLSHPEIFGAVGAMQPAIAADEASALSDLAASANARAPVKLRLLTSEGDYFRAAVERLSQALTARGVAHDHLVTPGPHDYAYNRGPGSYEMLLWHERVLRGLPAP